MKEHINVYTSKPLPGTVVATLTQEEVQAFWKTSIRYEAEQGFLSNPNCGGVETFINVADEWRTLWLNLIYRKHCIPYAWPLQIDYNTGYVYVSE